MKDAKIFSTELESTFKKIWNEILKLRLHNFYISILIKKCRISNLWLIHKVYKI